MFPGMTTPRSPGATPCRVYLLAAHPHWRESRANGRLLAAARAMAGIDINDLYASYPDYAIDVEAEQARVARADVLVLLHPIQWCSMPPLQKLWLDDVLTWGWAHGAGGTALQGKGLWLAATTGSLASSFQPQGGHGHVFDAFLPPYRQVAAQCGMHWLPPLIFEGRRSGSESALDAHVAVFAARLSALATGVDGAVDSPAQITGT